MKIEPAIVEFLGPDNYVDPIEWVSQPENIVLENENGDPKRSLSTVSPIRKVYSGHYYFKSRGRGAYQRSPWFP